MSITSPTNPTIMIEIMSPVGSYESLSAAIKAGAGAVYFGVGAMNMRSRSAANFNLEDLANIVTICKENRVNSQSNGSQKACYSQKGHNRKETCGACHSEYVH